MYKEKKKRLELEFEFRKYIREKSLINDIPANYMDHHQS